MNPNLRRDSFSTEWVRLSVNDTLYVFTKRAGFCLDGWPTLASYARKGWNPWYPDPRAADRVFSAYQVADAPLSPWLGLWCEASGQSVMPDIFANLLELVQFADSRLNAQWKVFEGKIPADLATVIQRFGHGIAAMLRLLAVCPEGSVLAHENAAVFYALAHHFNRAATDYSLRPELLRLLRGPQRAILERCGLVSTESARQVFRKLDSKAVNIEVVSGLNQALADPVFSQWVPQAPLHSHVLKLFRLRWPRPYLTLRLVEEIAYAGGKESDPYMRTLMELWAVDDLRIKLAEFHRLVVVGAAKHRAFSSLKEVEAAVPGFDCFEDLCQRARKCAFPPPPFRGTPDIVPITSTDSLLTEGDQMRNCAGSLPHQSEVRCGDAYFYRVYRPQRCTLKLEKSRTSRGKEWLITEIRTLDNGEPGLGTLQAVCDALGVPANPVWHPIDCVWSPRKDYACVPRCSQSPSSRSR